MGTLSILSKTTAASLWAELQLADSTRNCDRLLIRLDSTATAAQDAGDAVKLSNPNLDFYTLSADNVRLALDARPYNAGNSISLRLNANELYGRYVIKAAL